MAFAETFKALSDPVRREILNLLKGGRLTAGEIAGKFDMTAATVSYHLSQLKKAGLVFESREKNYIYYSLNASVLEEVLLWLQDLKGASDHENRNKTDDPHHGYLPAAHPGGAGAVQPPAGAGAHPF